MAFAIQGTMSHGGNIAVGALFVALGTGYLLFSKRNVAASRGRGYSEFLSILSAYVIPAVFVVLGFALIIGGAIGSI